MNRTKIWTDGGTSMNKHPFGKGYGSYRIGENGEIVSFDFFENMSANAAEISTMAVALERSGSDFIDLFSDSRVALKWLKDACAEKKSEIPSEISESMKESIAELRKAAAGKNVHGHWRPRKQIFKIFKH
jgi:ribonuclease HI